MKATVTAACPSSDTVASSPYATGGGGVTFERRVAAGYLALLRTGDSAAELGRDRALVRVAFPQAPRRAVDDLVLLAKRDSEAGPQATARRNSRTARATVTTARQPITANPLITLRSARCPAKSARSALTA